jgi:heme/copper-type cytochrome/quinol oxidase subunit 2
MFLAGILIIVGQLVCSLISLVGLVIGMMGFLKIYADRRSYPEPHPTNMKYSLIFYIFGIIITIIGVIAMVAATFSWGLAFVEGATAEEAFDLFLTYMLFAIIIVLAGELCMIFARYKLLVELMPPNLKGFLKGVMVLLVVMSIVGMASIFYLYSGLIGTYGEALGGVSSGSSGEAEMAALESDIVKFQEEAAAITLVNAVLGIITHVLFILCFYFAWSYQRVGIAFQKEKFEESEIWIKRTEPRIKMNDEPERDVFTTPPDRIQCPGCGRYMGMGFRKCPDCFSSIPNGVTVA